MLVRDLLSLHDSQAYTKHDCIRKEGFEWDTHNGDEGKKLNKITGRVLASQVAFSCSYRLLKIAPFSDCLYESKAQVER